MIAAPVPGDVWAVNTGNHLWSEVIRAGEALMGQPSDANHVIIVIKQDKQHKWWGLQGEPGGVGWADLTPFLVNPKLRALGNSNALQPRTDAQRLAIVTTALHLIGVQYDWAGGIIPNALDALRLDGAAEACDQMFRWNDPATSASAGRLICSSYAEWTYLHLGLACPPEGQSTNPAEWWQFNELEGWRKP